MAYRLPLLCLLLSLLSQLTAEQVLVETMFSPVGSDRSDQRIIELHQRFDAWIATILQADRVQVVSPHQLDPERRAQIRWRLECTMVEEEAQGVATTSRVQVFDAHSHRRPLTPWWSGSIRRHGPVEDGGGDLQALLRAALEALPR